jgi:hypothetical protein
LLNYSKLGWEPRDLGHLDLPFTEEEIREVIKSALKDKASGLDGFIGAFFAAYWDIIREDIIQAVQHFYLMNQQDQHLLNQAYEVLIPKKNGPLKVSDYRSIRLVHNFAKNLSKLLANRLAPELNHMISINQTIFYQKRCIHDNFMYVQQVVKDLHKKKISSIFIKLDISKAFDSMNWPYLLSIMQHLGFGQR